MASPNLNDNYSAAVQAEMYKSIIQTKNQVAPTLRSLKSGTGARGKAGALAGLEIPFKRGVPFGETALDVLNGVTSFEPMVAPLVDKMYVGLAQTGFTVEYEYFHQKDAVNGNLPETKEDQRDAVMLTYYQHHNFYAIGVKTGSLAVVTVGGGSGTITFANDNTARGRSKGSIRLGVSPGTAAGKRVVYESYTESTDTKTATFYITSKASATTAVIVVTDGGTVVAGDIIVRKGHYKKVPYGLGYYINSASRQFQGVNTATETAFNSSAVAGGNALITPTLMDTAKGAQQTRTNTNNSDSRFRPFVHLTQGNYKTLAGFGYNLRTYNAERGDANTTYALPTNYKDEDAEFIQDAHMEDAYIYMRDRNSLFYYRQAEMAKISKGDGTQYVGTNLVGSTEFYDNYGESYNLAYDARGDDGKGKDGKGHPAGTTVIAGLEIPANSQVSQGISVV